MTSGPCRWPSWSTKPLETADRQPSVDRVLMTADTVGGVWTCAVDLAAALGERGVAVGLATMGAPLSHDQHDQARAVRSLDVFESGFRLEWMDDPWDDVAAAGEWLLRVAEVYQPDVVHLNGYAHAALPWQVPVMVAGHSCVLSWWQAVKGEPAPDRYDRYRREATLGLQAAGIVVAPTRVMLAALDRHYGPLEHTAVIPDGRDAALFAQGAKEPFIFSAGRVWDEANNIALLDRAAPRLAWGVYVAGEEKHPDGGALWASNARFLGRLAQPVLAAWLARASVYALPARYEPFGLSALEAAFAGCALVLGDIDSLREVWGDSAVFVPPGDADALADALNRLAADDALRAEMAGLARLRALRYTPGRMADGYASAYRGLLRRRRPAAAAI